MARYDHLRDQGYENFDRDFRIEEPVERRRPQPERVRIAGTMWKVGFWGGAIVAGIAVISGDMGRGARGLVVLGGLAGGIALGLFGLLIDGMTALADSGSR